MRAIRVAGFVVLAESPVMVVLGRAGRSATLRRLPSLDERALSTALQALGVEFHTFRSCLAREPARVATPGHAPEAENMREAVPDAPESGVERKDDGVLKAPVYAVPTKRTA
jgi:hypothetical protein